MKKLALAALLLMPAWAMATTFSVTNNVKAEEVTTIKISLSGLISGNKSAALQSVLDEINQRYVNSKKIYLYLNSDGGNMDGALAMYYALRSTNKQVITVNQSMVASAATLPYCAGQERIVLKEANFIIHPAQMDSIADKNITPAKLATAQNYIGMYNRMFRNIYQRCTDFSAGEMDKALGSDDNRLYLTSEAALQHKLATVIDDKMITAPVSYFITD